MSLNGLVISDVHLAHNRTRTDHIIRGLYEVFKETPSAKDLDIIIISGDLFDQGVDFHSVSSVPIVSFIGYLLNYCAKYDILLRVLEGTPSHDRKQASIMTAMNDRREKPIDFKHVTELCIEHIERYDVDLLYVPDEWGLSHEHAYAEVLDCLKKHGLEQVDLSIMHGAFYFQSPANLVGRVEAHKETDYLSITRHCVFIGHYHTPTQFERIWVPGSFDRLAHGEEERKGYLTFTLHDDKAHTVRFVENKQAMTYKTLDIRDLSLSDANEKIKATVNPDEAVVFIRLKMNKTDEAYSVYHDLKQHYPNTKFTALVDSETQEKKFVRSTDQIIKPESLDNAKILTLVADRLSTHPTKDLCLTLLEESMTNA